MTISYSLVELLASGFLETGDENRIYRRRAVTRPASLRSCSTVDPGPAARLVTGRDIVASKLGSQPVAKLRR